MLQDSLRQLKKGSSFVADFGRNFKANLISLLLSILTETQNPALEVVLLILKGALKVVMVMQGTLITVNVFVRTIIIQILS